ncbi:MAG: hypothetical protein WCK34_09860, partial [Bacteroidota bacterium]
MTRKETEQRYSRVCELVFTQQLKNAMDELEKLIRFTTKAEYYYQLETLEENYKTLLRYAFDGYHDPQQRMILDGLCSSILGMADEIRHTLMARELPVTTDERMRLRIKFGDDPQASTLRIEEIFFHREVYKLIGETGSGDDGTTDAGLIPVEQMDQIFKFIWLTDKFTEDHLALLRRISRSEQVEWHEKCLVVSAITLSLLNQFDLQKILLLIEFAEAHENQVYQRALTGLVFGLMVYDNRVSLSPELADRLILLGQDESFTQEIELILLQMLMARETDKITREFEEEVLPEMKKMMPKIEDKLELNDLGEDEEMEGKNPGWKDMIEEVPGLFEKIERFSKMQMEGGDVFMSTFQLLKRFDFFD